MLAKLMAAGRRAERFVGPNDKWVEQLRKNAWRGAQNVLGDTHTFVREKGTADYITTVDASVDEVIAALWAADYQRNILSTVKYRVRDNEDEYVHSAWVYDPANTYTQHDVFLWERDGVVDVYGHREPSVRNPQAHLDLSTGTHGDPNHKARDALDAAGLSYSAVDSDTLI